MSWKRSRHNIAITGISNFSNDGMNANVSTAEDDDQKSHKDTSKTSPSVRTNNLSTNQLAAKTIRLRMKGKHDEAEKHSVSVATICAHIFLLQLTQETS